MMEYPYIEILYFCSHCNAIQIVEYRNVPEVLTCDKCQKIVYQTRAVKGLIYIASNPSMPGLLKIGLTNRSTSIRLRELADSTGVPTPFILEGEFASDSPEADESKIHSKLLKYKIPKKEFFNVERDLVIKVCEEVCGRSPKYLRYIEPNEVIFEDAISKKGKMYCPECDSQVLRVSKKRGWGCKKCQIYFDDSGKQIPDPRK